MHMGLKMVVCLHQGHPIAYYKKLLGPRIRVKFTYAKEFIVIVLVVRKQRHHFLWRKFFTRSDEQSLKILLEQREIANNGIGSCWGMS